MPNDILGWRRPKVFATIFFIGVFCSPNAKADLVVVDQREAAPEQSISAIFYQNSGKPPIFEVHYAGKVAKYNCIKEFDWGKVNEATKEFARRVNEDKEIDFNTFLSDMGFSCSKLDFYDAQKY